MADSTEEAARELCLMFDSLFPNSSCHRLVLNRAWVENWRHSPDTFELAFDYAIEHGWVKAMPRSYGSYKLTEEGLAVANA